MRQKARAQSSLSTAVGRDPLGASQFAEMPPTSQTATAEALLFRETGAAWAAPPPWVGYLARLGLRWQPTSKAARRITLLSMPCDSAAAGLVALGLMIRDLGRTNANDIDGHFDALLRHARQYLERCRRCRFVCDPQKAQCGYLAQANGKVRSAQNPRASFQIKSFKEAGDRSITFERKGCDVTVFAAGAVSYYLDGKSPSITTPAFRALESGLYRRIADGSPIDDRNLHRSFSGVCLATRIAGEAATRGMMEGAWFRAGREQRSLADLLAIRHWSESNRVTRTALFNTRTGKLHEAGELPEVVVADGADATLRVLSNPDFQDCDVIGVIDRTIDRGKLEQVGQKLHGLSQWYVRTDLERDQAVVPRPPGIGVLTLVKAT